MFYHIDLLGHVRVSVRPVTNLARLSYAVVNCPSADSALRSYAERSPSREALLTAAAEQFLQNGRQVDDRKIEG